MGQARAWGVVAGSAVGLSFGSVVFFSSAFAIFSVAWGQAFGWSQPDLARAASVYLALQTAAYPFTGWLLDRWGSRPVACLSIVLFAAALLMLSLVRGSLVAFYAIFAFLGLTTAATNAIAYVRAISMWFARERGLAIGLATGAQAVGIALLPTLSERMIERFGWPSALRALAALELLVCLPAVALLVGERNAIGRHEACAHPAMGRHGPTLRGILRSPVFWTLAACVGCEGLTIYAVLPNLAYILRQIAGMPARQVAILSSATGASFLLGRVGFGLLLDRLQARTVCLSVLAVATAGLLGFASATTMSMAMIAGCLTGAAGGGATDVMPYVSGRYFGVPAVSRVFGFLLVAFFTGAAIGPVAYARVAAGSGPAMALHMLAALQILPAALFLTLGGHPTRLADEGGTSNSKTSG